MNKRLCALAAACAAVFCGFSAFGADYYISSTGGLDDANRSGAADVTVGEGWQQGPISRLLHNDAKRDFRPPNSTAPLYRTGTFVPHIYAVPDILGNPRKRNGCLDIGCFDVKATGLMLLVRCFRLRVG